MSAAKSSRRFHLHHCFSCFSCFICSQEKLKQQVFRWLHLWWRREQKVLSVLSEAVTIRGSYSIYIRYHRYKINLSAFSANSKSQSISTLNIKPRPPPDLLGSFSHKWLRLKPSATQHIKPHWKWTWTMYNWGINTQVLLLERDHMGGTLRHLDNSQLEQGIILGNLAPAWSSSEISGPVHIKRFSRRDVSNFLMLDVLTCNDLPKECPLNASIGCVGIP